MLLESLVATLNFEGRLIRRSEEKIGFCRESKPLKGVRAIQIASENGHVEVIALLLLHPFLDPGANLNFVVRAAAAAANVHAQVQRQGGAKAGFGRILGISTATGTFGYAIRHRRSRHSGKCKSLFTILY